MVYYCPKCDKSVRWETPPSGKANCPHCGAELATGVGGPGFSLSEGDRLGGYEILRPLGSGGMGQVYLARQLSLNREVALKILPRRFAANAEAMRRFLHEVRITASIEHRNIVTVFEAGEADGVCFLAMAYVPGDSLERILKKRGKPLPEHDALLLARKVAAALAYVWQKKQLLHRDIKPGNIMLDRDGEIRILDLGIAKRFGAEETSQVTRRGQALGTPYYMSPEQAAGRPDVDLRSDIYSLGATLYHLVTGARPFEATSIVAVLAKQMHAPLPPPRSRNPELSEQCAALLERMLAKRPEDRPSDWQTLVAELDRLIDAQRESALGDRRQSQPGRVARRRLFASRWQRLCLLALLLSLMIGLLAAVIWLHGPTAPTTGQQHPLAPAPPKPTVAAEQRPPAPLTDTVLRTMFTQALAAGGTPLEAAEQLRTERGAEAATAALWLCLREYPGPDGEWAFAAARELLADYRRAGAADSQEAVLRAVLDQTEHRRQAEFAQAYDELASLLFATGRPAEAERLLWDGLTGNPSDDWRIAGQCGNRLVEHFRSKGDPGQLRLVLHYCQQLLPANHPTRQRAEARLAQLNGQQDSSVSPRFTPAQRQAIESLATWRGKMKTTSDRFLAARYLLRAGEELEVAELPQRAADVFREAAHDYGSEHAGYVGGEALSSLARLALARGDAAAAARCWSEILEHEYYGPDVTYGVEAATKLAEYYEQQHRDALVNSYLKRLADEFGAAAPAAAGDALLKLAKYYEQHGRLLLAREQLLRIGRDFPGDDRAAAKAAATALRQLYDAHGEQLADLLAVDRPEGPFDDYIDLNGFTDYVAVRERTTRLTQAKAVTVECWVWPSGAPSSTQYLVSRYGDNQRGFNLWLHGEALLWEVYDGRRRVSVTAEMPIPERTWTHIAATAEKGHIRVYVNGRLAGERVAAGINNDGAGFVKIGRRSWTSSGFFSGYLQHVAVHAAVVFRGPFSPVHRPRRNASTVVCVTATPDGLRDLCGNRLEIARHR